MLHPWVQFPHPVSGKRCPGLSSVWKEKELGSPREMRARERGNVRNVRSAFAALESPLPWLGEAAASAIPFGQAWDVLLHPAQPARCGCSLCHREGAQPFHREPGMLCLGKPCEGRELPQPSQGLPRALRGHIHTASTPPPGRDCSAWPGNPTGSAKCMNRGLYQFMLILPGDFYQPFAVLALEAVLRGSPALLD